MGAVTTIIQNLNNLLPGFLKSDAQIEAKIIDVVGTVADTYDIERQRTIEQINANLAMKLPTGIDYYRWRATQFQLGDPLAYDPISQKAYYAEIRPENQIVKKAYVVGSNPQRTLLVNAIGADGHLRPLDDTELASFVSYFSVYQPWVPLNIRTAPVAQITDPNVLIYTRPGVDIGDAVKNVNDNLKAYETEFRPQNTVTLTEIADVIQRYSGILAVGFSDPTATETRLDGTTSILKPLQGRFELMSGAFTFATELVGANFKTLA